MPVQHASNRLLEKMNRKISKEQLRSIFERVRERVPGVAIRTSVMVGFPGETEGDFDELKDFVQEMRFRHLGCFTYSQEEGTVAGRMPDQIDEDTKQRRQRAIMEVQRQVSRENLKDFVGKVVPVLVEGPSEEIDLLWQGRLATQAPEVDGLVYINDGPVKAGEIQWVEISETHDYDLVGAVVTLN